MDTFRVRSSLPAAIVPNFQTFYYHLKEFIIQHYYSQRRMQLSNSNAYFWPPMLQIKHMKLQSIMVL